MRYVATAEEGITWSIDEDDAAFIYRHGEISVEVSEKKKFWTGTDGAFVNIDIGKGGTVIGITKDDKFMYRKGVTPKKPAGKKWVEIEFDGKLVEATIGLDGTIFAITDGNELYYRKDISEEKPMGDSWKEITGLAVTSCSKGIVGGFLWCLNTDNKVFVRVGFEGFDGGSSWSKIGNE